MPDYDARMYDDVQEIRETVTELRKLLVGNGQVGLCEQARRNKDDIAALRADTKELKDYVGRIWKRGWVAVASMFGVGTVLWLWHVVGGDPARLPGLVLKWLGG